MSAPPLVLFDIDGTLLRRAGPHHREALNQPIRKTAVMETTMDGFSVAGMLDRDIVAAMLAQAGARPAFIRRHMPEIVTHAQRIYTRTCPNLQHAVCPGARMLLYRLWRRQVTTGLVTGNLTQIGWKKMERAGLKRYLRYGAFAELAKDRAGLVSIAIKEARRQGWITSKSPISLLGDHPNDIRAAKANGIRSIAVATGVVGPEELRKHSPDILTPDMRALDWEVFFT
jgi:phosphoglycolate phosphatase-like HAD superfamily hydrolase